MDIKIYSEVQINKEFEEYIREKIEKLKKFVLDEGYVEFYIKKDGPLYLTEIYLHSKNIKIFLKEKNNDMNKSVEILLDKTKVKLRKLHDKIVNK
ncbi:MAG: HPF/RaiA family ribosome-associated protein [Candidatus Omnitrophica bacterium]|nr:HPF/RaiA family ribosome-associated protein [Candidatus Omnitrophota bacterium]MCM8803027.1 HPF/RaiA family ribosome-associated protein [Candidatus Omnitrophota bacterium]